ncbi:DNA-binding protein [Paenibacillus chartarius]|uniref:DNA-binding protein n=1 Tax=Paenibacillus chartarius TaxID=747481 RepID=A0ABV6DTG6_9BACL
MPSSHSVTNSNADSDLPPDLSKPAQRAFAGAGITRLEQFSRMKEKEVLQLHGVGPKAIVSLRRAMTGKGLSFADEKQG